MADGEYITMVVHGESKVGKTWLGASTPAPRLILDAEAGGMRFVPGRKVRWDPLKEAPPEPGDWDTCSVTVRDTRVLDTVYQYLNTGKHPFESVTIDSLTEIQSRMKREIASTGILDQQDWGLMLVHLEDMVMKFRDLTEHPVKPLQAFVVITGTVMRDGKFRPFMQGQIAKLLPYKVDLCGYLFTAKDEQGQTRRGLRVANNDSYDIGNRLGGLVPDTIWDPTVAGILATVYQDNYTNTTKENS